MRFFDQPNPSVMKSLAALANDSDGQVVLAYVRQNAAKLTTQSCEQAADVQCRWQQGAASALTEFVGMTDEAVKKMRGSPQ